MLIVDCGFGGDSPKQGLNQQSPINNQERFNDQRSTKSRMCSNMRPRIITSAVIVAALAVGLSGQAANKSAWSVPRMPDGHPDMQGVWANNGMTPLERPAVWGNRATMTDAELADLKKRAQKLIDGGDAFFADELILAALEGKDQVFIGRHADRQLRSDLAVRAHLGQPDVAHHRPARWPHSAASACGC